MPCFRCGTRQTDPSRGASPWRRGVRGGEQVLVCPDCQRSNDWASDLDRCRWCQSVALGRRLGEIFCRDCGRTAEPEQRPATRPLSESPDPDLAKQVNAALDRIFGRT